MFYQDCKLASKAQITEVSRSVKEIQPPALFNLTQLQKEAKPVPGAYPVGSVRHRAVAL